MSTHTKIIARTAVLAMLIATSLSACSMFSGSKEEPKRDASGTVTESAKSNVFKLKVGDCLDSSTMDSDEVETAGTLPCSDPHDAEIYAEKSITSASYPTDIEQQAQTFCGDEFQSFIGVAYEDSSLDISYLYPTTDSWADGDRSLQCLVMTPEPVTKSMKDSKA